MICFGYIQGVSDTLAVSGQKKGIYCLPSEVTMGQMMEVVVKYLKDNPGTRHEHSATLIRAAFHDAWPCSAR